MSASESVVVRTTSGQVAGERVGGVSVFRGVPYAQPPVGPLRFASPRAAKAWSGVRDATKYSAAFIQAPIPEGSEDALYANVWSPDTKARKPVLVYIHGGGWMVGSGNFVAYNGLKLARRGDIVVVNFNYRLGAFGFGLHEDLADGHTGGFANWGLQDQAFALRWVRDNAAAFGGDPDNITLAGTSAGGSSTWQLGVHPETSKLVRRLIPISACHLWFPATDQSPADSRASYEAVAGQLGVTVPGLRDVPAKVLMETWDKFFGGDPRHREVDSGREYRGSVVDKQWMFAYDHEQPTPDLPTMVIHTDTEGSFYTGPFPPQPAPTPQPKTDAELRVSVRKLLDKGAVTVSDALVDGAIAAYRDAARADGLPTDPLSIWTEIWGDGLFRYQITRLMQKHARTRKAPQYHMEFRQPTLSPYFGTPHEATSPFLFGTYADRQALRECWGYPLDPPIFAVDDVAARVSETFMDLVASFARTSVPRSEHSAAWPAFALDRPTTLYLGGPKITEVGPARKTRQLAFWDEAGWVPRT